MGSALHGAMHDPQRTDEKKASLRWLSSQSRGLRCSLFGLRLSNFAFRTIKQLDEAHLSVVTITETTLQDTQITTVAGGETRTQFVEDLDDDVTIAETIEGQTAWPGSASCRGIFGWNAALFPTGHRGLHKIEVGHYRTSEMQIVSGAMGKEKIHYEAVPAHLVIEEMNKFLQWFNDHSKIDPVLKAAIAHLWFVIIHPFDDGDGRIARAISDLMLARADGTTERYYSMSSQILAERNQYYEILQKVQHSSGDITDWLDWFLHSLKNSLLTTETTLKKVLRKTEFWKIHENTEF